MISYVYMYLAFLVHINLVSWG